jgi:hypothetical protein
MSILLNGAGTSAADPILKGLGGTFVFGASTMDIATLTEVWLDTDNTFPGTNSIKSSISPAATVVAAGTTGSYDDTTKEYTISSTTGFSVGDYIYLSHASLTAGFYKIATLPSSGKFTLTSNPLNGQGNKTNISYQISWKYDFTFGTSPSVSSSGGTQNFFKVRASDSSPAQTDAVDSCYVRDAPSGTSYISIDGKDFTAQTTNDSTPSISILSGWTNNGGISHVAFTNHSVQTGNTDFRHSDSTTAEKTLSTTESNGLNLTAGDGHKYGRILFKSVASGVQVGVDIDMILDTSGPVITMTLVGR